MTLSFLNPSRNFNETRRGVSFSGHDGMFEIEFFVEAAVLARHLPSPVSEQQYLSAFDAMRSSIHDAALKVYADRHRQTNTLTTSDFR